jgi:hypothetical protein
MGGDTSKGRKSMKHSLRLDDLFVTTFVTAPESESGMDSTTYSYPGVAGCTDACGSNGAPAEPGTLDPVNMI